ncbi:hypothetical protein B7494_g4276 [Chlorociboria aeruginascens]|nr:hypothetical protein B7494_g4276 [Chlorociboria aeruginascens]
MESAQLAGMVLFDKFKKAGMSCGTSTRRDALDMVITGFKDMLWPMVDKYFQVFWHHEPTEAEFDTIKEKSLQRYRNARLQNLSSHSSRQLELLTSEQAFSLEQLEAVLQAVMFDNIQGWGTKIFNTALFQFLISGDITKMGAKNLWSSCHDRLDLRWQTGHKALWRRARQPLSGRIHLCKQVVFDPKNENSHARAFDTLCTQHGLGYVMGMANKNRPQQSTLSLHVECPKHSCLEAAQIMLDFIKETLYMVEQLNLEELEEYQQACIKNIDTKIKTLS